MYTAIKLTKDKLLDSMSGYYCLECHSILSYYDQGLCCDCGPHWETEVLEDDKYPAKWIKVEISVYTTD